MPKHKTYYHRAVLLTGKYQYAFGLVLLIVFNTTFYILDAKNYFKITIGPDALVFFLSIIVSIIGTIGAILIGFYFLTFQSIKSREQNWYLSIIKELDKLVEIHSNPLVGIDYLGAPLFNCIKLLRSRRLNTYPICGDEWEPINELDKIIVASDLVNTYPSVYYKLSISLARIQECAGEIGVLYVASVASALVLSSIRKLFYLLLIDLALIFIFLIFKNTFGSHSFLIGSIMFLSLYFTCVELLATLLHCQDTYRDMIDLSATKES